jgi:hypothetical protein
LRPVPAWARKVELLNGTVGYVRAACYGEAPGGTGGCNTRSPFPNTFILTFMFDNEHKHFRQAKGWREVCSSAQIPNFSAGTDSRLCA